MVNQLSSLYIVLALRQSLCGSLCRWDWPEALLLVCTPRLESYGAQPEAEAQAPPEHLRLDQG
eukprot:1020775-Rhodomonas_salina.2